MVLDLDSLLEMHPRLGGLAELYGVRAALGLGRANHSSGVSIDLAIEAVESTGKVVWTGASIVDLSQYDERRLTEDASEGVALALASQAQGWTVWIRGQRGQFCDWLMERRKGGERQVLALEVSGLAQGGVGALLNQKLDQVAKAPIGDLGAAIVVGLEAPQARMSTHQGAEG
jgi:hypothetical protein